MPLEGENNNDTKKGQTRVYSKEVKNCFLELDSATEAKSSIGFDGNRNGPGQKFKKAKLDGLQASWKRRWKEAANPWKVHGPVTTLMF